MIKSFFFVLRIAIAWLLACRVLALRSGPSMPLLGPAGVAGIVIAGMITMALVVARRALAPAAGCG